MNGTRSIMFCGAVEVLLLPGKFLALEVSSRAPFDVRRETSFVSKNLYCFFSLSRPNDSFVLQSDNRRAFNYVVVVVVVSLSLYDICCNKRITPSSILRLVRCPEKQYVCATCYAHIHFSLSESYIQI